MAMVYDPELLSVDTESEEFLLAQPAQQAWHKRNLRKVTALGAALVACALVAAVTLPAKGASKPAANEAMSSEVVGLAQELMGTLSTGLNASLVPTELKGCCPMDDGTYLHCCHHGDQCCPVENSGQPIYSCCAGAPKAPVLSKKCIGSKVSTYCPLDNECCDGRCGSKGSVCCGDLICAASNTCCKNKYGAYACGSTHSKCGGEIGGVPLTAADWPNPATPEVWYNESKNASKFGETVFRKEEPDTLPLSPKECADRCGLTGSCCGGICCARGATCCQNKFGVHSCGAVHSLCAGMFGGAPVHEDTLGYVEPDEGKTIFRAADDESA